MKKKLAVPLLLMMILLTLACSFSMEGIAFGVENEPENPFAELIQQQTAEAMPADDVKPSPADATPEPEYQSAPPAGSGVEAVVAGSHEYSVAATNFDCICQDTPNMTVDFSFKDNQVEITNLGGETMVYDKIDENKYKRSFMSYYILSSGEGNQVTETKVEEERHTVIILTSDGYVMENYQGSSASACCYYTFTTKK